ncbi:MAG: LLM class flavin-dependent oxidoreductase [Ilumatobacter sp.]|uniref:LLM class flavin-dependent oxidoreductase n=1 Tax=Ilumatobacter sp. TaxID=1967498 RepID=UPI00262ADB6C|nr:LLM class flavin-dependent oxidoreductase [Ilumatobacter sp.]MDJ0770552.1 LLM class flavin-dependent oxidoreductase [Ilumatobacter sp.]
MELGISLASATTLPAAEAGRHLVARVRAAHRSGLDSMSVGDNHIVSAVNYLQNTPTLARALAEWPGRPAGCLFLLPMWPPVLAAEQIGTLAAFHDGPFIVQTGIGGGPSQFAALGARLDRRVAVFQEGVRVVRGLLAGESVSSELFGFDDVSIALVPHQPVEWWMGTGHPDGLRRAARWGAAWYSSPGPNADETAHLAAEYRSACDEHGSTARVVVRRDVLVLADGDAARRHAERAVDAGYRGMSVDQLVVGTPAEAAEQLAPFAEIGVDQIVARTMGIAPDVDLETIESLGDVRAMLS